MAAIRPCLLLAAALLLVSCSTDVTLDEVGTTLVTVPGGRVIKAELVTHPQDMMRGMMFRDSLPKDRGMLFVHTSPGKYSYWMYQVKVQLDIIWMDSGRRVVEISANTPPCPSKLASECPNFGGTRESVYVLELAGGMAAELGIDVGDTLSF
jgi:uncharacterized membrane protein (UPF0127 family)